MAENKTPEKLTYNQFQLEEIQRRVNFFPTLTKYMLVTTIILALLVGLATYFIIIGWTLLGIALAIIIGIPFIFTAIATYKINSYWSAIKKGKVAIALGTCNSVSDLEEQNSWWKYVEVDHIRMYYLAKDPDKFPKVGEKLHVVATTDNSGFIFATEELEMV